MTQNNIYYKKGGKESPKLRTKNQKKLTKIWTYLGLGAKNEENKGVLFQKFGNFMNSQHPWFFINFGL